MTTLNKDFWENRYKNNETGWDVGSITTPLQEYINQLTNKKLKILIPGGGNSYEFDYLIQKGFQNVTVIDIAQQPLENLIKRNPNHINQFIQTNFFEYKDQFDLIIEQTFFCALEPQLRKQYAQKTHSLLKPNGKLTGLLFDFPLQSGPPFGGSKFEYEQLFQPFFTIKILEKCYNSIKPRQGNELFFIFKKNNQYK